VQYGSLYKAQVFHSVGNIWDIFWNADADITTSVDLTAVLCRKWPNGNVLSWQRHKIINDILVNNETLSNRGVQKASGYLLNEPRLKVTVVFLFHLGLSPREKNIGRPRVVCSFFQSIGLKRSNMYISIYRLILCVLIKSTTCTELVWCFKQTVWWHN
jgi:hypothetical protein